MSWLNMFRGTRGYERIEEENDRCTPEEQLLSPQYEMPRRPFPKKEIIWGVVMLVLGILLVGLGVIVHFEHWENRVPGVFVSLAGAHTCLMGTWVLVPCQGCTVSNRMYWYGVSSLKLAIAELQGQQLGS